MFYIGFSQQQQDSLKVETLDEVVITDSKFNLKRENSGKVITKITAKDLKKYQGQSIAEILGRTVGVEINGVRSNAGQNLNYFVRGGRNRQVLILIDGVQVTDASQIANDYDLRLLNADQVANIEILKGAASTLYGTGASTAVINITLKEAAKKPATLQIKSVLGTNQSTKDNNYAIEDFRNSVALHGSLNKFNYLTSFGQQYTNGLSAIASGTEPDAFSAYNGNLKLGYTFSKAFKLNTYASFDNYNANFDDSFAMADANNISKSKQHRLGVSPEFLYKNGSLSINAAYNAINRDIQSNFPTKFNAKNIVVDAFNRYNFNHKFYAILGVNYQKNQMESFSIPFGSTDFQQSINPNTANFTITDPYVNVVYVSNFGLNVNAGLRLNNHSEYGGHLVYNINPSFTKTLSFGYAKVLSSYSTAFITPSLYQLFEPTYGNANLKPEENQTLEFGAEISVKNKARFSVVYFNRNETNFIDFVNTGGFNFQYQNTSESFTASGLEFVANINITKNLNLNLNGTYTKVEEDLNLRVPKIKANARLDYKLCKTTLLGLTYQYNHERNDLVYNSNTFMNDKIALNAYNLLDFNISHNILNNKITLFANVSNILNEDYQELFGFLTRGRNVNFGFNLEL